MLNSAKEWLSEWWHGEQIMDRDYGPTGKFKRATSARLIRRLLSLLRGDWRWATTTIIASVAAVASVIAALRCP